VNPSVCDRDGNEKIFCKVHTGFRADKYAIFIGIAVFAMEVLTLLALLVQKHKSRRQVRHLHRHRRLRDEGLRLLALPAQKYKY
jgi:hypothetical protein